MGGAFIGKMALNHGGAYQVSAVKGQKLKEKIMNKKELCKHIERQLGQKINSLHPNINMHIPHNVLYTSPKRLTRRICF